MTVCLLPHMHDGLSLSEVLSTKFEGQFQSNINPS